MVKNWQFLPEWHSAKEVKRFNYLSSANIIVGSIPAHLTCQSAVYLTRDAKRVKQAAVTDGLVGVRERKLGVVEVVSRNAAAE